MTWSQEISQLITDVDQLTSAANVKKSELDASVASTETDKIGAEASIVSATASFASAGANATLAEAHKNTALAIYGTNAAQQTSLASVQASAALASGYAASASAALQQDLSGITAALYRSPNAVTSIFIYDTSKDSDGGAWTEKCQNTSWYNETIYGKWLGAEVSDLDARYIGSTVGEELVVDPNLNTPSYWSVDKFAIIGGQAIRLNDPNAGGISATINLTAGKTYRVRVTLTNTRPIIPASTTFNYGRIAVSARVFGLSNNVNSVNKFGNPGESLDFYITPTVNTNSLAVSSIVNTYTDIEAISCREVTALNTQSGDYFQLSTDGKFYRLWKNLLSRSEEFTSPWVLTLTSLATSTISGYISTVQFGDNSVQRILRNPFSQIAGLTYTISAFVQMDDGLAPVVGAASNLGDFSLVTDDTVATSPVITQIGTTSVYRVSATRVCGTTGVRQTGVYKYTTQSARTFKVTGIQLEISSAVTTYESKGVEVSTSEVFRGNKRDFPRLAGIVAEATNVTIYDLTEPGRPMWMRFIGSTLTNNTPLIYIEGTGINGLAALQSELFITCVGTTQTYGGPTRINFAGDWAGRITTSNIGLKTNGIAGRNTLETLNFIPLSGGSIVSQRTYTAAMTVLPDAPTDPVTGLRVPTIAIATAAGASVIRHNGTIVTPTAGGGINNVRFEGNRLWVAGSNGGNWAVRLIKTDFSGEDFIYSNTLYNNTPPVFLGNIGQGQRLLTNGNSTIFGISNLALDVITAIRSNKAVRGNAPFAYITPTYNTGWMMGNIRRTYLSDTEVGSLTGPELVTNGTFDSNVTSWSGVASTISQVSGACVITADGTGQARATQTITGLTVGRWYEAKAVISRGTGVVNADLLISGIAQSSAVSSTTPTEVIVRFAATATTATIRPGSSGTAAAGTTYIIDSVSVREVVADRSYRAQGAAINGTLTKTQLASGTSLVGYSGWSVDNYLREPYSADLDFGTGEWSASAWVNVSTTPRRNLLNFSEDFSNAAWDKAGFTVASAGTGKWKLIIPNGTAASNATRVIQYQTSRPGIRQTLSFYAEAAGANYLHVTVGGQPNRMVAFLFDLVTGTFQQTTTGGVFFSLTAVANGSGWNVVLSFSLDVGTNSTPVWFQPSITSPTLGYGTIVTGDGTSGVIIGSSQLEVNSMATTYEKTLSGDEISAAICDRAFTTGPSISLRMVNLGALIATVFDGTTTRSVTTSTAYSIGQWLKAEANYTTDGSLAIRVNGREVAVTRGNPLLQLTSRYNLLSWSENIGNNTVWANTGATILGSTISFTSSSRVYQTVSIGTPITGTTYTVSMQLSSPTKAKIALRLQGSTSTVADASVIQVNLTSTPTWYSVTRTFTSSDTGISVGLDNRITFGGDEVAGDVVVTGTQLELGSTVKSYQRVTTVAETNVAPLTIGNSYALDAPFPGSIALLKLGITVPTAEQSVFMYEQEKQLFRTNAASVLPDAGAVVDMSYDDATDRWSAISTANESYWNGLVRTSVTPVPAGSYSKITTASGVELAARITTNPGVDVTIPAYVLREELVKRAETANKLSRQIIVYDYIGGFTGNITTGSTAITTVANLTYPVSPVGARISGTGIPANTTIVAVVGTTIYISAAATATTTGLVISFLDFNLSVGFETESVTTAGVVKQEGATKDYTRLFDGFLETIRFAVAPGATTWVRIQATKSIQ